MLWRCVRPSRAQLALTRLRSAGDQSQRLRYYYSDIRISTRPSTRPISTAAAAEDVRSYATVTNDEDHGLTSAATGLNGHPFITHTQLRKLNPVGAPVRIAGLVRSIRKHKNVYFVHISDGSTLDPIQAVIESSDAIDLQNGCYVELDGNWSASSGQKQSHELQVSRWTKIGESDPEVSPLQKKDMSVDHLRTYPHLRIRTPLHSMLNRLRGQVTSSVHDFYAGSRAAVDEAIFVQPPLITSSDCEGAGETFTLLPKVKPEVKQSMSESETKLSTQQAQPAQHHYFRSPKYLTVSSQLHLEAFAAELGKVWTLSPVFRAEESDTSRHLSEFWMLEAEFRSVKTLDELLTHVQSLIQHTVTRLSHHQIAEELRKYNRTISRSSNAQQSQQGTVDVDARWNALLASDWSIISYTEAIEALTSAMFSKQAKFKYKPTWDGGLQLEHERWIVDKMGNNKPTFVTDYPKAIKPFYMKASHGNLESDRETVACFDLLLPFGTCEVVGGSLREDNLETLVTNMREKGLLSSQSADGQESYPHLLPGESLGTLQWYADLRRFGSSPHGGFGLGFDRLLMYLSGVSHVREIVPFPRTFGTAHC